MPDGHAASVHECSVIAEPECEIRYCDEGKLMARILITGSTDGLGLMAAELLANQHHEVVLHARNASRAADARSALHKAAGVVIGDLVTIAGMREVADGANAIGRFDAVVHNAAVGYREQRRLVTADGLCHVFAVNVLAPYLLTALIEVPHRLVYMSSGMHLSGIHPSRTCNGSTTGGTASRPTPTPSFSDAVLAAAVARRRPDVLSNAVDPGWVRTKMGGPGAPGDLSLGPATQAWLAVSEDRTALVSGSYFHHQHGRVPIPQCRTTRCKTPFSPSARA